MKPIAVVLLLSVAGLALWSGQWTHKSLSDDAARAIIDMRTTQCVKDAEARWGDRAEHMVAYDEASALSLAWDASEKLAKEQGEDRAPIIEQIVEWFSHRDNSPAYEMAFSHWAQTRADWEVNAPGCGREADYREAMVHAYVDNPVGRMIALRTAAAAVWDEEKGFADADDLRPLLEPIIGAAAIGAPNSLGAVLR
jgi:Zn-dependent M32 family carboxypeptidase